ncbi:MAG: exonuclease [Alphaproteobacteria bacterium]|nr:exonuclease [Alphaproteobacteria bacterium]
MTYIMVDIESDGPIPGDYSMIAIGAIVVEPKLERTFRATLKPISEKWIPDALGVTGFTREETLAFSEPKAVMEAFADWLKEAAGDNPRFIADNAGFDWQFVNWYFHHFLGRNPFGWSSMGLGSIYAGLSKSMRGSFKHLRRTVHTHDPLDDARGNAEALLTMIETMGLHAKL